MSINNKTESVKRKVSDLTLEDNESLDSPPAGKKSTGPMKPTEKMAHGGQKWSPPKFVMPSNEELEDAIQKHVIEESADIDQRCQWWHPNLCL